MKKKVAVINFNNSNIKSIFSALKKIGLQPVLINKKGELHKFENLVLPGVGTFKSGMNYLNKKNLANEIKKFYNDKKKIFAVCLGMQILLENGNEFGKHKGLGLIRGEVIRIKNKKVHLGWNKLIFKKNYITKNFFAYFVHSYHSLIKDKRLIVAETIFEKTKFISCFKKKNLLACQFHPEKSGKSGLKLIKNFFYDKKY